MEIWGAKISRVGVTMGEMEVATRVGCAQTLEDESGGGGRIEFAIAYKLRVRLAVVVRSSRVSFIVCKSACLFFSTTSDTMRLCVVVCPLLLGGSGGRLDLWWLPLASGFSATILVISRLRACWYRFHVDSVPQ